MDSINQLFEYKKVFVDSSNTCPPHYPFSLLTIQVDGMHRVWG